MDPFIARTPYEPDRQEEIRASVAVDRLKAGEPPLDRMEAGLAAAMKAGRDPHAIPEIEDRRYALAHARGLARMRLAGDEAPSLGSIDWARVYSVDASIQREAERSLGMDMLDREARHRWGSSRTKSEIWVQAGVSPSVFGKAAEEELVSMAAGRFHEIAPGRGCSLETSLMSAMAPAAPSMEKVLHEAAGTPSPLTGPEGLAVTAARMDERRFGPLPPGPDGVRMATLSDRVELAARSSEIGHRDARGLHDPTPGRHPFAITHEHVVMARKAIASGTGMLGGIAAAARSVERSLDVPRDGSEDVRLESAVARLAKRGPDMVSGMRGDVRAVIADMLVQRSAADLLAGRGIEAEQALERFVSNTPGGREAVRFTGMASDAPSVKAAAEGRFGDLDDARGYASAVRNAIWRSSMGSSPDIENAIEMASRPAISSKGLPEARPQSFMQPMRGFGR